jgi:uncharacterized integral membrane protein
MAGGVLFLLLGGWFIFWALSDSLLNMVRCGNEYSLFSSTAECRWPIILEALGFVLIGLALLFFVRAGRRAVRNGK